MLERFSVQNSLNTDQDSYPSYINIDIYDRMTTYYSKNLLLFGVSETGDKVVIKFPSFTDGAEHESEGLYQCYVASIPVPKPLALVQNTDGKTGFVSLFIPGERIIFVDNEEYYIKFGSVVRKMHDEVNITGDHWKKSGRSDFSFYQKHIDSWKTLYNEGILESPKAHQLLQHLADPIAVCFGNAKPSFVHYDLHDHQSIITPSKELYIIDFERWREEHPLNDIAIYLSHSLRTDRPYSLFVEFVNGYLNHSRLSEKEKETISFYLLFAGFMSIEYYRKYRPKEILYTIAQLSKITEHINDETIWKLL